MGPQMMQDLRDQAERFGTRFITDNVDPLRARRRGRAAHGLGRRRRLQGPHRDPRDGRRAQEARRARRGGARRPRRVLLRHLRRRVLQGPRRRSSSAAATRRWRRRSSSPSSPRRSTIVNRRDEFRASKIMLERARATENIEFLTPYVVEEFLAGETARCARARLRNVETGETASCRWPARSSRSATSRSPRSSTAIVDDRRRGLRRHRGQVDAHQRAGRVRRRRPRRPHLPPGGHRRRLRLPGRAGRRVVPARQPSIVTPASLEGTGDLAEAQWAPGIPQG